MKEKAMKASARHTIIRSILVLMPIILITTPAFSSSSALADDPSETPTALPTSEGTPLPTHTSTPPVKTTATIFPTTTPSALPTVDLTPTMTFTPTTTSSPEPYPEIEISPASFDVSLEVGNRSTKELMITNLGEGTLTFELSISGTSPVYSLSWNLPKVKLEPGLIDEVTASADQEATFLVYLTTQTNLASAFQVEDWSSRGALVYHALQDTAQQSQADLVQTLEQLQQSGRVSSFRPFYIVNAISVTAGLEVLNELAARPDVAYIEAEKRIEIPEPLPSDPIQTDAVEWGISKIRAPLVWSELDIRGEGIVVANIDTGVQYDHPALINQYRGSQSGSHDYNWFDPNGATVPFDNNGHGSHTMGTMVGNDGGDNVIGVAPAARWIAAKGCVNYYCTSTDLLASAEWVLAPYPVGGTPSQGDPNMRPHVVNNSWGGWSGNLWYQASVIAWRAAGIFPAFSAGNSGSGSGTVGSPGDYAESFASGATDSNDIIAGFSSRGPSSLTNEIKPDVSAPGVGVRSSWNNGDYHTINGTSMASPHTAGCVALIRSAVPDLDLISIESALTNTAVDLGSPGPDYDYGYGRIDCYAAVSEALGMDVPWLKIDPLAGSIAPQRSQPVSLTFNAANLDEGKYDATLIVHSNDPDEAALTVPITLRVVNPEPDIEISPTSFDLTLRSGETLDKTLTISNVGAIPLTFELAISTSSYAPAPLQDPDAFGYTFTDSRQSGGPGFEWIDISDSGNRLSLPDDWYFFPIDLPFNFNFYGTDYSQVAVASNGTLYFQDDYLGLSNRPIPSTNGYIPQVFVALYWDDLNPAAHGAIYYEFLGSAPHRKLIIQFQDVAHFGNASNTLTAQAILFEGSNSILVQYLDPSTEAGSGATLGIQGDPDPEIEWGLQYSYNKAVLSKKIAICYAYPGMPGDCSEASPSWLTVEPLSSKIGPGKTRNINVHIDASKLNRGIYSGVITIYSNDPDESPLDVPITLHVTSRRPVDEDTSTDHAAAFRSNGTIKERRLF
jgi:hypothetical protein